MNRALGSLAPLVPLLMLVRPSLALAKASVSLAYEAPEGCPAQSDFVAAVATRGGDFGRSEPAGSRRVMVVAIRKDDRGFAGAFQVRDDETATNKRQVHGPNCGEVVDALAVVTAIALRSDAADSTDGAAGAAPAEGVAPPTAPATAAPSQPATPSQPPPEERFRASTRIFPPRTEKVEVGAGTLRFDLQRSFTLTAGAVVGLIPSVVVPDYDLSLVVAPFVTTPEGAQRIPGLVFRLHAGLMFPPTHRSGETSTDLSGGSFGIGLCQSPHYDSRGLVLLLCGEYGGGFMDLMTKGSDGLQIQSKTAGYGSVMFGGEIQYNLGAVFLLMARVGGGFNFGSITAEDAGGNRIFGSSSGLFWSAYGLFGVGLRY